MSKMIDTSGNTLVNVTTSALPTGAATAAKQDTGNTSVASIDTKLPAQVSGRVPVDGSGVTQPVSGTVSANLNAGSNNIGNVGVLTVPADPFGANADAIVAAGAVGSIQAKLRRITQGLEDLKTSIVLAAGSAAIGKLSANSGVIIGDVNVVAAPTGASATQVQGTVAHDGVAAQNPVRVGGKAQTAISGLTLVQAGDATDLHAGVDGVQIVRDHCNLEDIVSGNASNTDGTSTAVIAAAGAGIKQYLTSVTITNTSAAMTYVELKSATTVKYTLPVPASGGVTHTFNPPLPPNAANEAWNFDPFAATTTLICSMVGFKSKV